MLHVSTQKVLSSHHLSQLKLLKQTHLMKNKLLSYSTFQRVDGSALNAKITILKEEKIAIDARKREVMKIMKVSQST